MASEVEELLLKQIKDAGLPEPQREVRLIPERLMRLDFYWPVVHRRFIVTGTVRSLAVEVDGGGGFGRHGREPGASADCEKAALCMFLGKDFLRFTTRMVKDGRAIAILEGYFAAKGPAFLWEKPMKRTGKMKRRPRRKSKRRK